jgi:phage protein D
MSDKPEIAGSPNVEIVIAGDHISVNHFISFVIDRDMYQPDMASIVLANQNDIYSSKPVGAAIEINVGKNSKNIFKGELIGLEPVYKGGEKAKILIRSMNKFHQLLRKRKSVTFTDKTDEQILKQVVGDAGLSLEWKHEKSITYKHVYQHNQTDMEFLRTRAARMGCHVWCVDSKIFVQQPTLQGSEVATLLVDGAKVDAELRSFSPRLNSTNVVKKVTVKGWNPETKELISGDASVQSSQLGSETSVAGSNDLGKEENFTVDHPIWSKEEAMAIAKARLQDASLTYITGEAEIKGDTEAVFDLGKLVKVAASADDSAAKDPFNGKYYIMGITHRNVVSKGKDGGYVTILRFARDAAKQ